MTELQERLTGLGLHLDAERAARLATNQDPTIRAGFAEDVSAELTPPAPPGLGVGRLAVAAALVAVALLGVAVVSQRSSTEAIDSAGRVGQPAEPTAVPADAPVPGAVAPFVESPPAWFGEPRAGRRPAADRLGQWVSTAIGQADANGAVSSPIWIGATTGSLRDLGTTNTVVIGAETLQLLDFGTDWRALARLGEPTVVAAGTVDAELLADVLNSTQAESRGDEVVALTLSHVPAGYTQLLPAQTHAADVANRRTLTNTAGDIAINETSDWVEPELAAAATGADYQAIPIGETTGWTGRTDLNPYGPVTFLIWSPEPGVVVEIGSTNPDRSIDDLVDLAETVSLIPSERWDAEVPAAGN